MSDLRDWVAARAAHDLLRARLQRTFTVPTPAPGADWSTTVPGGVVWEVLSVHARFVTSAVVQTRAPSLLFVDGANRIAAVAPASTVIAGSTQDNYFMRGAGVIITTNSGTANVSVLPEVVLNPGVSMTTQTFNLDAGDQWSQIVITVREWSAAQVGQHLEKILGDELFATYADREV